VQYEEEAKIYRKFLRNSANEDEIHEEPHTLELASMFSVATRLEEPSKLSLLEKVKAYNEDLDLEHSDITKLKEEGEKKSEYGEGMKGITTRYIEDQLANAVQDIKKQGEKSLNPLKMLDFLEHNLEENASIDPEEHEELKDLISEIREQEYKPRAKKDVISAMAFQEDELEKEAEKYFKEVVAYVRGNDDEVNERHMREIEEQIGIREDNKDDFRREKGTWALGKIGEGKDIDPLENPKIREAVTKRSFENKKDHIDLTALVRDSKELDEGLESTTIDNLKSMGYSKKGAMDVLSFVGTEEESVEGLKEAFKR
ncbi:MAG: serine protein kinase PrkA, partial [Candidatus Nanohaloarchaea archaeon]|nr:serine protein kinase PrkA [Candidatus Nanohaloarchaea archaeon]